MKLPALLLVLGALAAVGCSSAPAEETRVAEHAATTVPEPIFIVGDPDQSVRLETLTAPGVMIDMFLPNRFVCGLSIAYEGPATPASAAAFLEAVELSSEGLEVVTSYDADRRELSISVPKAASWDAFVNIKAKDGVTPLATLIDQVVGGAGTLNTVRCPAAR